MALTKDQKEQIEKLSTRYIERLERKATEGKELIAPRRGRIPKGVSEDNLETYISLRDQLATLKKLRQESTGKLRELKEQMEELRGPQKKRAKKSVK